jgi:uncharacterized protein YjbI with pentapeptide repeats
VRTASTRSRSATIRANARDFAAFAVTLSDNSPMAEPNESLAAEFRAASAALRGDRPADRRDGLRELERLAQDNPRHRQALVDPICGYLRRPFSPPSTTDTESPARRELAVRRTAQRILGAHLRRYAGPGVYWPGIDLDLRGAELVDFDLREAQAGRVSFAQAKFSGATDFRGTVFAEAGFAAAFFSENTDFTEASFTGEARFSETLFAARVLFEGATFRGPAAFRSAKFYGAARFGDTEWAGPVLFDHAYFTDGPVFSQARFREPVRFDHSRYDTEAVFKRTRFDAGVSFAQAEFREHVTFKGARFGARSPFTGAQFHGNADLSGADLAELEGACASYGVGHRRRWPKGWTTVRNRESRMLTLFRNS